MFSQKKFVMRAFLLSFFLFTSHLLAEDFNIKEIGPDQNTLSVFGNIINASTGKFIQQSTDLEIKGQDSLSLKYFCDGDSLNGSSIAHNFP